MKDEQNWRPGDVAEAMFDVSRYETGAVAMPRGSRHVVAGVTVALCGRGCCEIVALRFIGWDSTEWADSRCFRKIVPTFKEPCREGRAPIAPRKRTPAENAASYVRRLLDA